jgi:hypothetical protein
MPAFTPILNPLINGVAYSFSHIELEIAGLKMSGGFKEIKYDRKRKRDQLRSNSPDPTAQTQGENSYSGSVVVFLAWWLGLKRTIVQQLGKGYGDKAFSVNVSYSAPGFDPFQDVLIGCHFDSTEASQTAGTAPLERTIDLQPLKIIFDGEDDLETPLFG